MNTKNTTIIQLQNSQIHKLSDANKLLVAVGLCTINIQQNHYILSLNQFTKPLNTPLLKLQFPNSNSYLFINQQDSLYALSYPKLPICQSNTFQSQLKTNKLLREFNEEGNDELKQKLTKSWPNLSEQILEKKEVQKKQSRGIWGATKQFFKKKGQMVGNGFNKAFGYYNEKIGDKNQERWQKIKTKAHNFTEKSSNYWNMPSKNKTANVVEDQNKNSLNVEGKIIIPNVCSNNENVEPAGESELKQEPSNIVLNNPLEKQGFN